MGSQWLSEAFPVLVGPGLALNSSDYHSWLAMAACANLGYILRKSEWLQAIQIRTPGLKGTILYVSRSPVGNRTLRKSDLKGTWRPPKPSIHSCLSGCTRNKPRKVFSLQVLNGFFTLVLHPPPETDAFFSCSICHFYHFLLGTVGLFSCLLPHFLSLLSLCF